MSKHQHLTSGRHTQNEICLHQNSMWKQEFLRYPPQTEKVADKNTSSLGDIGKLNSQAAMFVNCYHLISIVQTAASSLKKQQLRINNTNAGYEAKPAS